MNFIRRQHFFIVAFLLVCLSACAIGPDYKRPDINTPQQFKETDGWKQAMPNSLFDADHWWEIYNDPELNSLIAKLNISNQDLASAEAQYRQAKALLDGAKASFYPTISTQVGAAREGTGGGDSVFTSSNGVSFGRDDNSSISKTYTANLDVSWELDVWGKLRRNLESNQANVSATASDLGALKLSLQSQLVQSYLQLRILDQQARLLSQTSKAYERSIELTENKYNAGIVAESDVTQAKTQLYSAKAAESDIKWQRAKLEHAIAVLTGTPPDQLTITVNTNILPKLPFIPQVIPSYLLEHRPDVSAAEQQVIAANANIGVAEAAWFPDFSLVAGGGYQGDSFSDWFTLPNRFWSIGPQFAIDLFDGGSRSAEVDRNKAVYDQTVADYRSTVLTSFKEVEDSLAQLKYLKEEDKSQKIALSSARQSLDSINNQYNAGLVDYNNVVSLQVTALDNEVNVLALQNSQLLASVQLIVALGGGWKMQEITEDIDK